MKRRATAWALVVAAGAALLAGSGGLAGIVDLRADAPALGADQTVYLPIVAARGCLWPTPKVTPSLTPVPMPPYLTAEGTLIRVWVSFCQAGETHYLPECGLYLYSDSIELRPYEGKYVRVRGWEVPSPECRLANVFEVEVAARP